MIRQNYIASMAGKQNIIKSAFREWKKHNPLFLGAGISFYIILSMGPILVVLIFIVSLLMGGNSAQNQLVEQIQEVVGPKPAEVISKIIQEASSSPGRTITILSSIPLIFFGSTMVFFQLRYALNVIFESEQSEKKNFKDTVKKYSFSFIMLLILGGVLILLTLKNPILNLLKDSVSEIIPIPWLVFRVIEIIFSLTLVVFVFFMIYYLLPDKKMKKSKILAGSVVTAVLFVGVQYLIGFNAQNSKIDSAYGAIGSATIVLLWIFYSSLVFLLGAAFTKVISRRNL